MWGHVLSPVLTCAVAYGLAGGLGIVIWFVTWSIAYRRGLIDAQSAPDSEDSQLF